VKLVSTIVILSYVCPAIMSGATVPVSSAFLAPVGQATHYRYLDLVTTPKGARNAKAQLTLTTTSDHEVEVTIEGEGQQTRQLSFYLDPTGALQPISPVGGHEKEEQEVDAQALLHRLSLAARIGAHAEGEVSVPVTINIPWASKPVLQPTLSIDMTKTDSFIADAIDTTSVNPPQQKKQSVLPFTFGLGILGGAVGGTPGTIVGISTTVVLGAVARHRGHLGPSPLNVNVHVSGQLTAGRLSTLAGDQEEAVHSGGHTHALSSDQWSLVAESSGGLSQ
jgi:hypothetical protein